MEPGRGLEDPVELLVSEPRRMAGTVPGDELGRQVGHQDRGRVAVLGGSQVRRPERLDETEPARGDEALAERVVARVASDPVGRPGRALEDEPLVVALEAGERRARPAVVRERALGQAVEEVLGEQLGQPPARPRRAVIDGGRVGRGHVGRIRLAHDGGGAAEPSGSPSR